MTELADVADLKSAVPSNVRVQIPSSTPAPLVYGEKNPALKVVGANL